MIKKGLRKLLGRIDTWRLIKDRGRKLFRCAVKHKRPSRPPPPPPPPRPFSPGPLPRGPPPPRPPRPDSLYSVRDSWFENASPVFSPELRPWRTPNWDIEAKETEIDLRTLEEILSFPSPVVSLTSLTPKLEATDEAKKDLEMYHSGEHPAINGPWPWDNIQQFQDVLVACITTKMTMCEIGQFLETMCHGKDKLLDGLVTVMINDQDTYFEIGHTVLMCFGPRDRHGNPYYGGIENGDENMRPAPPNGASALMADIDPPHQEPKHNHETRYLEPWTISDQGIDNGEDQGGKVVRDGLQLRRLPVVVPNTERITRSRSLIPRRTTGVEGMDKVLGTHRRAVSSVDPDMRPISPLPKDTDIAPVNEAAPEYQYNERSAWSEDSDHEDEDEEIVLKPRPWSFRHTRTLSWISGSSMRRKALSDPGAI
ncbi:hypothetical protein DTO271G3_4300 [Paecilomyces variotii]|nr:hypothetical protein DTO271G3_4300 [Paecilomyces variotii]